MKKKYYIIFSLLLLTTSLLIRLIGCYGNACEDYVETGVKGKISEKINSTLSKVIEANGEALSDIAELEYSGGLLRAIRVDTASLSLIAAAACNRIQTDIAEMKTYFGIPLGNAFGSRILSGKGPRIGITVIPLGAVEYQIKSELISSGINQTLHRISIEFESKIRCIAPFEKAECSLNSTIIVCETLIVGDVPQVILPSV